MHVVQCSAQFQNNLSSNSNETYFSRTIKITLPEGRSNNESCVTVDSDRHSNEWHGNTYSKEQ